MNFLRKYWNRLALYFYRREFGPMTMSEAANKAISVAGVALYATNLEDKAMLYQKAQAYYRYSLLLENAE